MESVLAGCNALYGKALQNAMNQSPGSAPHGYCSSNFVRTVKKDLDDARVTVDELPWDQNATTGVDTAGNALGHCPAPTNCTGGMRKAASYGAQLAYAMSIGPEEYCAQPGWFHAGVAFLGVAYSFLGEGGEEIALGAIWADAYCHLTEKESVIIPLKR